MSDELKVLSTLKEIVAEVVPTAVISSDEDCDRALSDIGIDSLDTMSILLEAQGKFGVEIPDEEIDKLTSLRAIAEYVANKQG